MAEWQCQCQQLYAVLKQSPAHLERKNSLALGSFSSRSGGDTMESAESCEVVTEESVAVLKPWTSLVQGLSAWSPSKNYNSQKSRAPKGACPTVCGRGRQSKRGACPARSCSRSGGSGGYGSAGGERGAGDGAGAGLCGIPETASFIHPPCRRISWARHFYFVFLLVHI